MKSFTIKHENDKATLKINFEDIVFVGPLIKINGYSVLEAEDRQELIDSKLNYYDFIFEKINDKNSTNMDLTPGLSLSYTNSTYRLSFGTFTYDNLGSKALFIERKVDDEKLLMKLIRAIKDA